MTKKEFLDKIDNVRGMVECIGDGFNAGVDDVIALLNELKSDANLLLEDEYDAGYELGLNRGWNHEGMDCE